MIKFPHVTNIASRLLITGTIDCLADRYRPVTLTARDDDTIGEVIVGSSGTLVATNRYAGRAIELNAANTTYDLHDLRIRYADKAITVSASGVTYALSHCQLTFDNVGLYQLSSTAKGSLRNVLIADTTIALSLISGVTNSGEHMTLHRISLLRSSPTNSGWLSLTNCLLISVTNNSAFNAGSASNVKAVQNDSGIFQAVGAGRHYLAPDSPYRNCGDTNINPALLSALRTRTTYPPLLLSSLTGDTLLTPQAQRNSSIPDLGYAYDPLDYVWSDLTLSGASLTLSNVAVAVFGTNGLTLQSGAKVVSQGAPLNLNRICPYYLVQEAATNWGAPLRSIFNLPNYHLDAAPELDLRFTDLPLVQQANPLSFITWVNSGLARFSMRDCTALGGTLQAFPTGSTAPDQMTVGLTNNLLEGIDWWFIQGYGGCESPIYLQMRNNLFYRGKLTLTLTDPLPASWYVHDNLFYTNTLSSPGAATTNSHNGYYITPALSGSWGSDKTLSSAAFESGRLGRFYYATNGGAGSLTDLVDAGSRNATNAGLYHFTTATNETKEASSTVDIGFHSVALDASGQPIDTDSDGWPDVLEDANGTGTVDSGETSWTTAGDWGLRVWITRPSAKGNIP